MLFHPHAHRCRIDPTRDIHRDERVANRALLKPRLGMRRMSGIWPPSNRCESNCRNALLACRATARFAVTAGFALAEPLGAMFRTGEFKIVQSHKNKPCRALQRFRPFHFLISKPRPCKYLPNRRLNALSVLDDVGRFSSRAISQTS